jgi:hypothetical protein
LDASPIGCVGECIGGAGGGSVGGVGGRGDVHVRVHGTVYGVDQFKARVAQAIGEDDVEAAR